MRRPRPNLSPAPSGRTRVFVGSSQGRDAESKRWNPDEDIKNACTKLPYFGWFFREYHGKFSYQRIIGLLLAVPLLATLAWVANASGKGSVGERQLPQALKPTLQEAEQVLHEFLEAPRWNDLFKYVRHPEKVQPMMAEWYEEHPYDATRTYTIVDAKEGMLGSTSGSKVGDRWAAMFKVLHDPDVQGRVMTVELTSNGFKVDWETAVGYGEMFLDEFIQTSPTSEVAFRLTVGEGFYYNFEFEDETVWKSYGFVDPSGMHALHGFAKRGSALERTLSSYMVGEEFTPVMVRLQLPKPGQDVALITSVIQRGWIKEYSE